MGPMFLKFLFRAGQRPALEQTQSRDTRVGLLLSLLNLSATRSVILFRTFIALIVVGVSHVLPPW
jgi:hypothetical protein